MSTKEGKVVVVSPVTMRHNEATGMFAASFDEMGLTGFGDTPDEARTALKTVFRNHIRVCREHGLLEKSLNRLKVRWHWESEYPEDGPGYEDMDPPPLQQLSEISADSSWLLGPEPTSADLRMAA